MRLLIALCITISILFLNYLNTDLCAAVYYIDGQIGRDSNSGSASSPWRTIHQANTTLKASDRVYIKAGTYYDQPIIPSNSGTSEYNRIIFEAFPGHKAIISGGNTHIEIKDAKFITVKGFTFSKPGARWAHIMNTDHVTIESCSFEDAHPNMKYFMILVEDSSYFQFLYNTTNTTGVPEDSNVQHDLFSLQHSTHSLILGNLFGDASHNAFGTEDANRGPDFNVIKGNTFTNKYRHALALNRPDLDYILVEDNTFIRVARDRNKNPWHSSRRVNNIGFALKTASNSCIYRLNVLYGCDSPINIRTYIGAPNTDNWWYHNTVYDANGCDAYDSGYDGSFWYGESADPNQNITGNRLFNNINWKAEDDRWVNVFPTGEGMVPSGNIISYNILGDRINPSLIRWGNDKSDLETMEANNPQWVKGTNISQDPLFANPDNIVPDFTLQPRSPAIDAGTHMTKTNGSAVTPSAFLKCDEVAWAFSGPNPPWLIQHPEILPDKIYFKQRDGIWVERAVMNIDYSLKTITIESPATWDDNTAVYFRKYRGSGPDIGAYEFLELYNPKNLRIVIN